MMIAIASGKGGTGKTTVAASLAKVWPRPLMALDLDVEEPNLHLFLKPVIEQVEKIYLEVPRVDKARCTLCGSCSELCQFKAISLLGKQLFITDEMCHGCGGCMAICPVQAIQAGQRELGVVEEGLTPEGLPMLTGRLRIGEAMAPPLMSAVKAKAKTKASGRDLLLDSPPGVSCPAMNAVQEADVILLVAEPTPFGFHDFQLACQAFRPLKKTIGVIINRAGLGDNQVQDYCQAKGLPILAEIPFRRELAEYYAKGNVFSDLSEYRPLFDSLAKRLIAMAQEADHA